MRCPACSHAVSDLAAFCDACGARLLPAEMETVTSPGNVVARPVPPLRDDRGDQRPCGDSSSALVKLSPEVVPRSITGRLSPLHVQQAAFDLFDDGLVTGQKLIEKRYVCGE
jgi:hypothetical protein